MCAKLDSLRDQIWSCLSVSISVTVATSVVVLWGLRQWTPCYATVYIMYIRIWIHTHIVIWLYILTENVTDSLLLCKWASTLLKLFINGGTGGIHRVCGWHRIVLCMFSNLVPSCSTPTVAQPFIPRHVRSFVLPMTTHWEPYLV